MPSFAFSLSTFALLHKRGGTQPITMDNPTLPGGSGLRFIKDTLQGLSGQRIKLPKTSHYMELADVQQHGNYLLVLVEGGSYGEDYDVVDTTSGKRKSKVAETDALAWTSRVVFFFPPSSTCDAVIAAEFRGNNTHRGALINVLEDELREVDYRAIITHDITDTLAWSKIFDEKAAHIQAVEFQLTDPAGDGLGLATDRSVSRVKVQYSLIADGPAEKRAMKAVTGGKKNRGKALIQAVGGTKYDNSSTSGLVAVVHHNGKPRRYRINEPTAQFRRDIDSQTRLTDAEFIKEVQDEVILTFKDVGVEPAELDGQFPLPPIQ